MNKKFQPIIAEEIIQGVESAPKRKTSEEIQALKDAWVKDPCWDIEDSEGFEAHYEELWDFQYEQVKKWNKEHDAKIEARSTLVREQTGVADKDILSVLHTWSEIEHEVSSQDRYIGGLDGLGEQVKIELMQAQIRATLLQAAQLKRIADALESMDDGDSLVRSAAIWGSEQ